MKILLKPLKKSKVRVGRGMSSGHGKTSTRGMNGQKSRTGSSTKFFEGGQTKLINRIPKARGFKSVTKKNLTLTSDVIAKNFKSGDLVSKEKLIEKLRLSKSDLLKVKGFKVIKGKNLLSGINFTDDIILSKSIKQ